MQVTWDSLPMGGLGEKVFTQEDESDQRVKAKGSRGT